LYIQKHCGSQNVLKIMSEGSAILEISETGMKLVSIITVQSGLFHTDFQMKIPY
jgi:hypothetical protein